jgi:hypothetical protein
MLRVTVTATGTAHTRVRQGRHSTTPDRWAGVPVRFGSRMVVDFRSFADAERIEAGDSGFDGR